jgi:hypothetical protein
MSVPAWVAERVGDSFGRVWAARTTHALAHANPDCRNTSVHRRSVLGVPLRYA